MMAAGLKTRLWTFAALCLALCGNASAQKFEGLASTPQMGWNS